MPKGVDRSKTPTGKTHVLGPGEITIAVKADIGQPGKPDAGVDAEDGKVKFLTRAKLEIIEKIEALQQEARESSLPQATPSGPAPSEALRAPTLREKINDFIAQRPGVGQRKLWKAWNEKDKNGKRLRPRAGIESFPKKDGLGRRPKPRG